MELKMNVEVWTCESVGKGEGDTDRPRHISPSALGRSSRPYSSPTSAAEFRLRIKEIFSKKSLHLSRSVNRVWLAWLPFLELPCDRLRLRFFGTGCVWGWFGGLAIVGFS